MTTFSITAKQLMVQKRHATILHHLDFAVQAGAVTGLIGPSGSGKTTLMRTIVGVQRLSGGGVTVLGQPAGAAQLRSQIGYVTQNPAIYQDLTVQQNLRYFATLVSATSAAVAEVIQTVHLTDKTNQLVMRLSGGEKARVSLAIALLGDPALLVLDEPTVGLDPLLRRELWQLFAELAVNGKTLLISSHVMDEADRCDNLLLMRDGRLLWNDSRQRLLAQMGTASVEEAFVAMINQRAM